MTRTEGNPLFVGEIVRLLAARASGPSRRAAVRLAIPQSVRDVIARRLTHLSRECNRVLVLASVIGREFGIDALDRSARSLVDELSDCSTRRWPLASSRRFPGAPGRVRFATS